MRQTTFSRTSKVDSNWKLLINNNYFVAKILAFEAKKPLISPLVFPFTLKRLASDNFYL